MQSAKTVEKNPTFLETYRDTVHMSGFEPDETPVCEFRVLSNGDPRHLFAEGVRLSRVATDLLLVNKRLAAAVMMMHTENQELRVIHENLGTKCEELGRICSDYGLETQQLKGEIELRDFLLFYSDQEMEKIQAQVLAMEKTFETVRTNLMKHDRGSQPEHSALMKRCEEQEIWIACLDAEIIQLKSESGTSNTGGQIVANVDHAEMMERMEFFEYYIQQQSVLKIDYDNASTSMVEQIHEKLQKIEGVIDDTRIMTKTMIEVMILAGKDCIEKCKEQEATIKRLQAECRRDKPVTSLPATPFTDALKKFTSKDMQFAFYQAVNSSMIEISGECFDFATFKEQFLPLVELEYVAFEQDAFDKAKTGEIPATNVCIRPYVSVKVLLSELAGTSLDPKTHRKDFKNALIRRFLFVEHEICASIREIFSSSDVDMKLPLPV